MAIVPYSSTDNMTGKLKMDKKNSIEAFARYHRAKEEMAELTQIGIAAIGLLKLNVTVVNGSSLLGEFVDSCQVKHWGKGKNFNNPVEKTTQIGDMFCRQILVQQVSAFDLFTTEVVSDLARFSSWARSNLPELSHEHKLVTVSPQGRWISSPCCNEIKNKCGDLKNRLTDLKRLIDWQPSTKLGEIVPLLDLARMARNRIVHSDGIIGADFAEEAQSKETKTALECFQKNYSKGEIPPLPVWERGKELKLSPANAIFFGAVLNEFAKEINRFACTKLSYKEFVEMAFYYGGFVETHAGRTIRQRDLEGRIRTFLSVRYLFGNATSIVDIPTHLKDVVYEKIGKVEFKSTFWKIGLQRHKELVEHEKLTLPPNGVAAPRKKIRRT